MLILTRKALERIHIGDSVVVTILEIRGNKARVGIDAPKEVHILRSELLEQNESATSGSCASDAPTDSYDPRGVEALETDGPVARPETLKP